MDTPFRPHNDLEKQLVAVHAGELSADAFMSRLLDEQVFMPVQDEKNLIKGFQRSTQAQPLVVEDEDGTRILVLFTSPERAKPFLEDFPDFRGGLLVEFAWVVRRLGGGFPISLNPGLDVGLDFDADMVAQMFAALPPEGRA